MKIILGHASWILVYASALICLMSSKLWYIPAIFIAVAFVITKICNAICEKQREKIKNEDNCAHLVTIITDSLHCGVEKLDLGELSADELYKAETRIENSEIEYPYASEVSIGPKLGISIAATVVMYIVSVAIKVL